MSYTSPKVEVKNSQIKGKGVFAKEKIKKDELIFDFLGGGGKFYSSNERQNTDKEWQEFDIQVSDDLFWGATTKSELEIGDYLNHSCEPNCGMSGALKIVTMKNIEPKEELTFDYTKTESHNFKMKCECKKKLCRKIISGNDWKNKELQKRYSGYFSPYLQEKIDFYSK